MPIALWLWLWLLWLAVVVDAQGQQVLSSLKIKTCIQNVAEYMPGGVTPNVSLSCTQEQGIQLVNIIATPNSRSTSLVSFSTGDTNVTSKEAVAVGAKSFFSGRALVRLQMSPLRVRYVLDEIGVLPSSYKMSAKECGTGMCGQRNRDRNDGNDAVLFCPQNQSTVNPQGFVDDGVRGSIGRIDRLMSNELWPPNVGCRQTTVADMKHWYLSYLNDTIVGLRTRSEYYAIDPASVQVDDVSIDARYSGGGSSTVRGNWILQTPYPQQSNPGDPVNRIPCHPDKLPYFLDGDVEDYFQSSTDQPLSDAPRYRNVFFADNKATYNKETTANECFRVKWTTCVRQSDADRRRGLPCRDFRFVDERNSLAFGTCWGGDCQSVYQVLKYEPSDATSNDYVKQWSSLEDAQVANPTGSVQRGNTLGPMCSAGKFKDSRDFPWPNNFANTPAYYPLVNVNQHPESDDPADLPAEGRNFDAYGAPGQCGQARCTYCVKSGPMNDMGCDNDLFISWRFPIYKLSQIRERPRLEFNANATVINEQNVTLVFPVGLVSIDGSANERFVLSSFFSGATDGGGGANDTSSFQVSILSVSPLGEPPTQRGNIISIDDKWRPGGVISLDEAYDFAIAWIVKHGSDVAAALPFEELARTFDPTAQTGATLALKRALPDTSWARYPCCQEPGAYSLSRLALLRSIYPEMDRNENITLAYRLSTVFRSIAKRGARQYGKDGDGLNDGPSSENPWGIGKCGATPCPPPDGWMYVEPPFNGANVGVNGGQQGITNEWWLAGENVNKYCRTGQIGTFVPGVDIITVDPAVFPDDMRRIRREAWQKQLDGPNGAYSAPLPYLPPLLQFNDGRQRLWTCDRALCFEAPEDYGLQVWFQFAFTGSYLQLVKDLPKGRFVSLTAPADACNITIEQDGVLFAAVQNTGSVGADFSVFIDCASAPFDITTPSPQTRFIMPGEQGRYQFVIRGTGPMEPSLQQCTLLLRNAGEPQPLSLLPVDCLTRVPQGFIDPNVTTTPVPTTAPSDGGAPPPVWLDLLLAISFTVLFVLGVEFLRRWGIDLRRWIVERRLSRQINAAKLQQIEEASDQAAEHKAAEQHRAEIEDRTFEFKRQKVEMQQQQLELQRQQNELLRQQAAAQHEETEQLTALIKSMQQRL